MCFLLEGGVHCTGYVTWKKLCIITDSASIILLIQTFLVCIRVKKSPNGMMSGKDKAGCDQIAARS
ncbi:hypothetical protein DWB63_10605 [Pseudodesulfovibrio sp. S3]|nr:hypothetical protein DWB63_10605 [Pseudodesulfovibrio sp. S3]